MTTRCFACDKPISRKDTILLSHEVDTRDDQIVFVGADCFRKVKAAGDAGYQPPKGGPRLYPVVR